MGTPIKRRNMRKKNSLTIKKCKEIQRRGTIDPTLELLKTQLDSETNRQKERELETSQCYSRKHISTASTGSMKNSYNKKAHVRVHTGSY